MIRMSKESSNKNHLKALGAIRGKGVLDQDRGLLHSTSEEMIDESKTPGKLQEGLGVGVMKEGGMIRLV